MIPESALILPEFTAGARLFDRFTLREELGRGALSVVWSAREEPGRELVALKLLPPVVARDAVLLDDLLRECRRSIDARHPAIAQLFDVLHDDSLACVVREFARGHTLAAMRAQRDGRPFEVREIRGWAAQLCAGLAHAHAREFRPAPRHGGFARHAALDRPSGVSHRNGGSRSQPAVGLSMRPIRDRWPQPRRPTLSSSALANPLYRPASKSPIGSRVCSRSSP